MNNDLPNIGRLFYKDYYSGLPDLIQNYPQHSREAEEAEKEYYERKNKFIFSQKYDVNLYERAKLPEASFTLETIYPGLLLGSGYQHETGQKGEIKIGFFFDYTSGLPIIPGSSIKGFMRSYFPLNDENDNVSMEEKERLGLIKQAKTDLLSKFIKEIAGLSLTFEQLELVGKESFEGLNATDEPLKISNRDIFYDAVLSKVNKHRDNKNILDSDFITPHPSPMKNPIPLLFAKVLQGVAFDFHLNFKDSKSVAGITAEHKKELLRRLLISFGLGAKTNVGYGQFQESDLEEKYIQAEKKLLEIEEQKKNRKENQDREKNFKNQLPIDIPEKGIIIDGEIIDVMDKKLIVKFTYRNNDFLVLRAKTKGVKPDHITKKEGDVVKVKVNESFVKDGNKPINLSINLIDKSNEK